MTTNLKEATLKIAPNKINFVVKEQPHALSPEKPTLSGLKESSPLVIKLAMAGSASPVKN